MSGKNVDLSDCDFLKFLKTDLAVYGHDPIEAPELLEDLKKDLYGMIRKRLAQGSNCVYFRSGPVPVLDEKDRNRHLSECLPCRLLAAIETLRGGAVAQLGVLALVVDSELAGEQVLTEN